MALYDNIINKYFKESDPEELPTDDIYVPLTKDKAETTGESSATEDKAVTTVGTTAETTAEVTADPNATEQAGSSGVGAYMQLWDRLYGGAYGEPESEEEIEEREKRERRNSRISALGDALGGIANIWGATKGATPMDISSLSEANKKRYDYAKERREKNQEARRRGMYVAGSQDIAAEQRAEELRQAAEERARLQTYREEQDETRNTQWQTTHDFNVEQAEKREELERQRLEDAQKRHEADVELRKRTIAVAEKKANAALNNSLNNATGKVTRFGLSDGSNITVPESLKGSYVADVYNQLVNAAGDPTIDRNGNTRNPILSFMKFQYGQKEPGINEMMTAIQLYKDQYDGIEDYMVNRATEYTENYNTPVVAKDPSAPGSPGEPIVPLTEDELQEYLIE